MTDAIVFDFVNKQVMLRSPSGETKPAPEKVVLVGTSMPPSRNE